MRVMLTTLLLSGASAWQLLTPTTATRCCRAMDAHMTDSAAPTKKLTPAELKKEGEAVVARRLAIQTASGQQSGAIVAANTGAAAASDDAYALARASWKSVVQARAAARAEWSHGAQYGGMQRGPTGKVASANPAGAQDPRFATSAAGMVNPGRAPGHRGVPEADTRVMSRPDWSQRAQSGASLGGD